MRIAGLVLLSAALLGQEGARDYFVPQHRVAGIGLSRQDLDAALVRARTDLMIQSQTFSILRDPEAAPGAKRITSSASLQKLFRAAAARSGLPASLIEAVAYLESWGDSRAESPSGPRGIMQISAGTARLMGLKVVQRTRYRTVRERVRIVRRGRKPAYRTVTHRVPAGVRLIRDDRLVPARAIPAAARYLASLEAKFGGRDWALFAYHCGEGCVAEMLELTRHARGVAGEQASVPAMFFSASPAWNRELYKAVEQQMRRDYSPTYYFRIMRAQQLLALYREDPEAFGDLARAYRSQFTAGRAPHRLSVWLKRGDLVFRSEDDIRVDPDNLLVPAPDRPAYFGYALKIDPAEAGRLEDFTRASPAALGTLMYVAFETRRLFERADRDGEEFRPLPVTALVEPEDYAAGSGHPEALAHCTGQVFDIDYAGLPPTELECLRFVLDDLGWSGFLGFIEEGREVLHVGCSPDSRDFFAALYREAAGRSADQVKRQEGAGVGQGAHVGELE